MGWVISAAVPAMDSVASRMAVSTCEWTEVFLNSDQARATSDPAQALVGNHSLVLLHDLASIDECEMLRCQASEAATHHRPIIVEHPLDVEQPGKFRRPVMDLLDEPGLLLADKLLLRAVERAERHMPGLMDQLFQGQFATPPVSILRNENLTFTEEEPAINVYTAGGGFKPHWDFQGLTVLLLLSHHDAFTGGGTSFWAKEQSWREKPANVIRPKVGTALLFGGEIRHAGECLQSGERCVFVASFSIN